MENSSLERNIINRGKDFFASIKGEAPSLFNKGWWMGRVMEWAMNSESFKVQLFRFVDVLPYLSTRESLARHIEEYFATDDQDVPKAMKWGASKAGIIGKLTGGILHLTIRSNLEAMARQFIIGENIKEALKTIKQMRRDGFAFTIDILGEATVSEQEAAASMDMYLQLLTALQENRGKWAAMGGSLDWGYAPQINVSVKPSALFSRIDPVDFEGSVGGVEQRLAVIYRKVIEVGGFLHIDMEHHHFKDITLEVYKRLRASREFRHYPHFGVVLQSYLRTTDADLHDMLQWSRENSLPIALRLVKGAYWDYETVTARQNGWEIPVYTCKAESDAAFERHSRLILENHDTCYFACGSHNIRSISAVMEMARELRVPEDRYEFQVLYGMAEPVRKGLLHVAGRVRLYAPYGNLLPGMAYLVRRLLENTANESFLRQSFGQETEVERLMENPLTTLERAYLEGTAPADEKSRPERFQNEPVADFSRTEVRQAFGQAIARVRQELGRIYPLSIGGKDVRTEDLLPSVNPAAPDEIIGQVCQASGREIDLAIQAARTAMPAWAAFTAAERARFLFRAADLARKRVFTLAAWQVLEVGKQWAQAQADVAEAIDFLEYYGREAMRLSAPQRMGQAPGELNHLLYRPRGITAVIAPWNFPLAISCGMSAAALAAGNPVLFKPAGPSSVVGHGLARLFEEAGLPAGVFNYVPGRGKEIGDTLVEHPDVAIIAFTGSMEVGCHILNRAAACRPGQPQIKRVIAEMGGKNAIIIDDDADLDEAVRQVIASAFAFQGQKCSACSRVIVVAPIYDRFIDRLIQAADSLAIGPAEDPAHFLGPVIDGQARDRIMEYVRLAKEEGRILLCREVPDKGYYVPLTIVEGITPEHRLAQEEIFGPVLAVMKVGDINQALDWANSTRFGLTGAIFSRSPSHLEKARKAFNVGNLYLNRGCTGALVERQPFGGFKMSGIGSKAGGPDYLLQFMEPRLICENTMRRGFAPAEADA
ncbi:MAG: L-glutamate gamma-semialdehyde dehydrogenase [Desulfocapsaceae bacterium]|nr:L-glutamate gamma-semialdehyde dehydrogenase [Desulfocapsaceae bacterium]